METRRQHKTNDRLLLNHIRDIPHHILILTDLQGAIITWNKAAEKISGYSEEEITGKSIKIFFSAGDQENRVPEKLLHTAAGKGYSEYHGWMVRKNGRQFRANTIISVAGQAEDKCLLVLINEQDSRRDINELAEGWKYIFEKSDWAFVVTIPDSNIIEMVNPAFARMYGYTVEELTGQPVEIILGPESRARMDERISALHQKGHSIYESHHIKKDGTSFPVIVDATAIKDEKGRVLQRLVNVRDISGIKEIEEASMRNEEKFLNLFEQASDGIFIADLNGKYTNVNSSACKLLGYSKEELIGKSITDLIRPEDVARLGAARQDLLKPGTVQVEEWELKKKDGSFLPVEISTKILPDGQWQAFVRDISERKETEQILLQSEKKFRGLLEESHDAIVIINKHGTIEFINNQFRQKFGYLPDEIIGKSIEVLIPERFKIRHVIERMKYMSAPVARPMGLGRDVYARRKDNSEFPVDISVVPSETAKGLVFTAFVRDLSDRQRFDAQQKFLAETSSALSENIDLDKRLQNLVRLCVPFLADFCVLFIANKNRLLPKAALHRDPQRSQLLDEVAAKMFSKPEISPYTAGSSASGLAPLLIEHVTDSFLHSISLDDEHFLNFKKLNPKSMMLVPLIARETIIGVLMIVMDGAERRFSQEDIPFISILRYRIGLSIDNINLFLEARQETRVREDILSIVSHDLRNPLAAIKSSFDLIPRIASEKEKLAALMETLTNSANYMERLINDLLDFSKIHEGSLSLKPGVISVKEIAEQVTSTALSKAHEKSIELSTSLSGEDALIKCDPDRIKQVLNNLIGNAIKFTPAHGKVQLTIREQKDRFYFSVSDTGPGISKESLGHIFERYWQERGTAHLGTGLGLYIAKGIIEAFGGRIWTDSEVGKGSNFQFEIPKKERNNEN